MKRLKEWLMANHGLAATATDAEVDAKAKELISSGVLTLAKYLELAGSAAPAESDPQARLASLISSTVKTAVDESVKPINDRLAALEKAKPDDGKLPNAKAPDVDAIDKAAQDAAAKRVNGAKPDSAVQPEDLIPSGAAQRGTNNGAGRVDVVDASARYSQSKSNVLYSHGTTEHGPRKFFGERPVVLDTGETLEYASQAEKARAGAVVKMNLAAQLRMSHLVTDHDRQLFEEALAKDNWCGDLMMPGLPAPLYLAGRKLTDAERAFIKSSTIVHGVSGDASGGQNLIVQQLENEVIRAALLNGELAPYVDNRTVNKGNAIDTASMVNLTISSGTTEDTAISAQSTSSLLTKVSSTFFAAVGALKIGRDFLADATPNFMQEVLDSYSEQLKTWLDNQIANGDGTTEPLGLFNSSGTNVIPQYSPSPTGWDVQDVEAMLFGIGKQYRANKGPSVRFVMNDTSYRRIRRLAVSSTDQRRLFGMSHEDYKLLERPVSIENNIANTDAAFVDLSRYRLWRRLGMEMRVSDQGSTLMLANAILVVVRARYAGRLVLGEAMAEFNSAPSLN